MSKNHDNRRKLHAAQLAKQVNHQNENSEPTETNVTEESNFLSQYKIIREDLMKLREDLGKGYDLAKDSIEKRTILSEIMKLRDNL